MSTEAQETSQFVPTGKTVIHRGTTYEIFNPPPGETRADSPYILRSPRGKWFTLIRNKPNPNALFAVSLYSGMKVMPGWFTDKDGELKSIN